MALFGNPEFYRRRAAAYDAMVRSRLYNSAAWGTRPDDFVEFAARAFGSDDGPLLEVAAGTASATRALHVASRRDTTLVDSAAPMLRIAERAIAGAAGGSVPTRISFECRDMLEPASGTKYRTILGLGLLHLVDDVPRVVDALLDQLSPGGGLFLSSLFRGSRRSAAYLALLHRSGEVVTPRSLEELRQQIERSSATGVRITSRGSMAYVEARRA